jgi:hypothetical protein
LASAVDDGAASGEEVVFEFLIELLYFPSICEVEDFAMDFRVGE